MFSKLIRSIARRCCTCAHQQTDCLIISSVRTQLLWIISKCLYKYVYIEAKRKKRKTKKINEIFEPFPFKRIIVQHIMLYVCAYGNFLAMYYTINKHCNQYTTIYTKYVLPKYTQQQKMFIWFR